MPAAVKSSEWTVSWVDRLRETIVDAVKSCGLLGWGMLWFQKEEED